jgi:hypothetical protein
MSDNLKYTYVKLLKWNWSLRRADEKLYYESNNGLFPILTMLPEDVFVSKWTLI